MSLGTQLRDARRRMKQTASEVAAATRMKVQIVEALEQEDFSKVAAPIYGKGFIKLYAEHVGLDPVPLVNEYMARFVDVKTPSLISEESPAQESSPQLEPEEPEEEAAETSEEEDLDLFSRIDRGADQTQKKGGLRLGKRSGKPNLRAPAWKDILRSAVAYGRSIREKISTRFSLRPAGTSTPPAESSAGTEVETPQRALPLHIISTTLAIIVILVFVISGLSRCIGDTRPEPAEALEPETLRLGVDPPAPYFN